MYETHYHRAGSIADAAKLFADAADARYLAGGQTLIPTMKQRLAAPSDLIDLNRLADLKGISGGKDVLAIGAGVTHAEVATSDAVKKAIPAIAYLAGKIGDPAVRHRGTIGGSLANNDPAADYPGGVIGLGATIHTDKRGDRRRGLFQGLVHDRARRRRDHHQGRIPGAGKGRLHEIRQSGVALCDGRRLRRENEGRSRSVSASPAPDSAAPIVPRISRRRFRHRGAPTPSTISSSTRTTCCPICTDRRSIAPTSSRSWPSARSPRSSDRFPGLEEVEEAGRPASFSCRPCGDRHCELRIGVPCQA